MGAMERTSAGKFAHTLTVIAARQGVQVTGIMVNRADGRMASTHGGTVTYGPALDNAPLAIQEWVAGHELAHIALDHGRQHRAIGRRGGVLALVAGALCLPGIFMPASPVAFPLAIVGLVLLVAEVVWVFLAMRAASRRQEIEADQLARDWGFPVTPAIADWLASAEHDHGGKPGAWRREHAAPHDRINN